MKISGNTIFIPGSTSGIGLALALARFEPAVPMHRLGADGGKPSVAADPEGRIAGIYKAIARKVAVKIAAKARDYTSKLPPIVVQK